VREELERVEVPDAEQAGERSWRVVEAAFAAREAVPRERRHLRLVAVALAAAAVVAGALATSPGLAVLDEIREVVGVERSQPALFSLPSGGRLLVSSDAGLWVVQRDGFRRLLGAYQEGSWSPFGRYIAAAGPNELAALEPDGKVRWTLARPGVRSPRWTGSATDTRIAYLDRTGLRVVAGDGTGDRPLVRGVAAVAPSWRPGLGFVLAYADRSGRIVAFDVAAELSLWRTRPGAAVRELRWTSDGRRLHVMRTDRIDVYTPAGAHWTGVLGPVTAAAPKPGSHAAARADSQGTQARVTLGLGPPTTLFAGAGPFTDLEWSPDGRWLLIGWAGADQWVFVRSDGGSLRAASDVAEQFRSKTFPRVESWCCPRP
jgi:hypothetical protein